MPSHKEKISLCLPNSQVSVKTLLSFLSSAQLDCDVWLQPLIGVGIRGERELKGFASLPEAGMDELLHQIGERSSVPITWVDKVLVKEALLRLYSSS